MDLTQYKENPRSSRETVKGCGQEGRCQRRRKGPRGAAGRVGQSCGRLQVGGARRQRTGPTASRIELCLVAPNSMWPGLRTIARRGEGMRRVGMRQMGGGPLAPQRGLGRWGVLQGEGGRVEARPGERAYGPAGLEAEKGRLGASGCAQRRPQRLRWRLVQQGAVVSGWPPVGPL